MCLLTLAKFPHAYFFAKNIFSNNLCQHVAKIYVVLLDTVALCPVWCLQHRHYIVPQSIHHDAHMTAYICVFPPASEPFKGEKHSMLASPI